MTKYSFKSQKWTKRNQHGSSLPHRHNFTFIPILNSFYIYGGFDSHKHFDDLWRYESTHGWRLIKDTNIGARQQASGVALEGTSRLIVFGGMTTTIIFTDMHMFDTTKESWS